MFLASVVWAQPAAAAANCPDARGEFDGDGSNRAVATYTVTPGPRSAVIVTLTARSVGDGQEDITVNLIGASGQTVLATGARHCDVEIEAILRTATTFTATVNVASEPIQWSISSRAGYCGSQTVPTDTGVYYIDIWQTSFFVLLFELDMHYVPDGVPAVLTIPVGATVAWRNRDTNWKHSVTSDDGTTFSSGELGSPWNSNDFFIYTKQFTQPGTFTYHDRLHPQLVGTIIVTGNGKMVFR
ncbi:MAG: hypothetical protein ABIW85_08240 [Variovorax sp.]